MIQDAYACGLKFGPKWHAFGIITSLHSQIGKQINHTPLTSTDHIRMVSSKVKPLRHLLDCPISHGMECLLRIWTYHLGGFSLVQSMKISKFGSNFREKCMDFPNSSTLRIIWFDFGRVFHSPWSNTEVLEVPHQSSRFFQWFSKKSAIHLLAIPHVFPRPSRFYWSEGSRKSLGVPDAVDWCMAGGEGSTNLKNGWWRSCNDDTLVLWCHLNCPKFMAVGTISTFMYLNICI